MKNIFITLFLSFFLISSAFAAGSGGSSGGSGGSSGGDGHSGNYSASFGYDKKLKKILFEIEKKQNYEEALLDLEVYVYENPQNANGWNLIGFASRKLGKYDDAELYYKTGLEIDPNHDGILAYQGELFLETGRYDLALSNLDKLTENCLFNCNEKKELSTAINLYKSENNL